MASTIKLNVGGSNFITSLGTFTRYPKSRLSQMVYDHWLSSGSNPLFVDRDGTHFRHILNFCRDGPSVALPSAPDHLDELRREAEFFKLDSLLPLISTQKQELAKQADSLKREKEMTVDFEEGTRVRWSTKGLDHIWGQVTDAVLKTGYLDWLRCSECGNEYELRLCELPVPIVGWQRLKECLNDAEGVIDSIVNDNCLLVRWVIIYASHDGYIDSSRFFLHAAANHLTSL